MSQFNSKPNESVQLETVVVGAGLSGLAAAISIALSGHKVTVLESAKELLEVGAGLQLTPNCTRILQQWDIPDRLWQSAAEPTSVTVHRYSGQVLALEKAFDKKMRSKYGAPFIDMHRVDLQLALYDRARQLGVEFKLGETVTSVDAKQSKVTTASGIAVTADIIVAADGLWSKCRSLFTANDEPKPTNDLAYRVVLNLEQIEDPELRRMVEEPSVHFWIGPGAHAVGYSMRSGKMYNIVLLVPDDLPEGVRRQAGSVDEMRSLFKGWDPILEKFLGIVDGVDKWKLMHRKELSSWVSEEGNLVYIGDSCHPMLPYLAQGANSAVEDGAVLGLLLGHIRFKEQVPKALKMYETLRKQRGDAIVKETFKQRENFHMPDGPEQEARDRTFLSQLGEETLKGPFPSKWTCPDVQPWLYGYDAFEEVRAAVEKDPFEAHSSLLSSDKSVAGKTEKGSGRKLSEYLRWLPCFGS